MSWRDELHAEFLRATEALRSGNAGRARTSARRAAGIAITEWQRRDLAVRYGPDFLRQIRGLAADTTAPDDVRKAAFRLQEKLREDFRSASDAPTADARIVVRYVLVRMGEPPEVN